MDERLSGIDYADDITSLGGRAEVGYILARLAVEVPQYAFHTEQMQGTYTKLAGPRIFLVPQFLSASLNWLIPLFMSIVAGALRRLILGYLDVGLHLRGLRCKTASKDLCVQHRCPPCYMAVRHGLCVLLSKDKNVSEVSNSGGCRKKTSTRKCTTNKVMSNS